MSNPTEPIIERISDQRGECIRIILPNGLHLDIDYTPDFQAIHYGMTPELGNWIKFEDLGVPNVVRP
jgi:hypothetical protein